MADKTTAVKSSTKTLSADEAVAKIRELIKANRRGEENLEEYRLTTEELRSILKTNIKDRKRLYQTYVFILGEKKELNIAFDPGEKPMFKDGQMLRPVKHFRINGVVYQVPKGISVSVPIQIYEMEQEKYNHLMHTVETIDLGNGKFSAPLSPTQEPQVVWDPTFTR